MWAACTCTSDHCYHGSGNNLIWAQLTPLIMYNGCGTMWDYVKHWISILYGRHVHMHKINVDMEIHICMITCVHTFNTSLSFSCGL